MEEKETVRVARLGSHTTMMGFTPPDTCNVCEVELPYVIFVNDIKKTYTWLCETCFKKGYPDVYSDTKLMDDIEGDITSIPLWSKGINKGG